MNDEILKNKYIKQLSEMERKALEIARDHLKSSFDITKSNGFLKFKEKQTQSK